MLADALNMFVVNSGVLSLAVSLGSLFSKKSPGERINIFFLFLCFGLIEITVGLMLMGGWNAFPHLMGINVPMFFCAGPLYYFFLSNTVYPESVSPEYRWARIRHYIPAIVSFIAMMPVYLKSGSCKKMMIVNGIYTGWSNYPAKIILFSLCCAGIAHLVSYIVAFIAINRKLWNVQVFSTYPICRHVLVISCLSACIITLNLLAHAAGVISLLRIANSMIIVMIVMLFIVYHKYPEMVLVNVDAPTGQQQVRSYLNNIDTALLIDRLENLFRNKRIYADDSISLPAVADRLGISPHQLSELLNRCMGKNFWDIVNMHRIEEAQRMLVENQDRTVISIAYDVGYNSQSAFYKAFMSVAGTSPGNYRKRMNTPN